MKLEPVTELDKRNNIFLIYGQFDSIQKADSRCIVCKTYLLINSNLLSYRNLKQK